MPVTEPTEAAPPIDDLTFDDALAELQRTIAELEEREARRRRAFSNDPAPEAGGRRDPAAGVDPMLPLRLAQERLRTERVFADLAQHNRAAGGEAWDLAEVGLTSIAWIVKSIVSH